MAYSMVFPYMQLKVENIWIVVTVLDIKHVGLYIFRFKCYYVNQNRAAGMLAARSAGVVPDECIARRRWSTQARNDVLQTNFKKKGEDKE